MELKFILLLCTIINSVLFTDARAILKYACGQMNNIMDIQSNRRILNLDEYCEGLKKPCMPKYCGLDEVLFREKIIINDRTFQWPKCTSVKKLSLNEVDYTQLEIYNASIENGPSKTRKNFLDDFHLVRNGIFENRTCVERLYVLATFLLENGMLASGFNIRGFPWTKTKPKYYCVDLIYNKRTNSTKARFFIARQFIKFVGRETMLGDKDDEVVSKQVDVMTHFRQVTQDSNTKVRAVLVSCVFLMIVLVVYSLLPELRDLYGQILVAYVASLFTACLLLAIMRLQLNNELTCRVFSFVIYYCFIASFCWLHIMSYDIWWTFRGLANAHPIHRRGETFTFLIYCLYAFGLPLVMTIAFIILNEVKMSHTVWYIQPNIPEDGCFIAGLAKLLYFYVPILILILFNWIFYLMTAFNVWRLNRTTATLDSTAAETPHPHHTHQNRFAMYRKLSAVMSLYWVLEVLALFTGDDNKIVWFISDIYNIFIGLTIFVMFVCKQKTMEKLFKRYERFKIEWRFGETDNTKSTSTTSDSNSSQET